MFEYIYSNYYGDGDATHGTLCTATASGIDEEAIHQIRLQGRIERERTLRRGFALLKSIATRIER